MNILFVLYGDFSSNSANPLVLYARELHLSGHSCAVAVPSKLETVCQHESPTFRPILYGDVLAAPESVFPDGRPADVIHACTPREVIRRFITSYMIKRPTPLVIYLEDNESWISTRVLGFDEATLVRHTEREISDKLPDAFAHPFFYDSFIGLADSVAVIQDKLKIMVPPWVCCETVMIGVDLQFFSPRPPDLSLRTKYGIAENEKVIVYHGGLNSFVRPAIETLCRAVGLINQQGYQCRLLRTGPFALDFLDQLPPETTSAISDLGLLSQRELPDLLALAAVFVQPGQCDPFEDLRLPGKVPEFLAMGRPVVMPDVNIAHLFRDGLDAVLLRTGGAEEIAAKCIGLFSNPQQASMIGQAGRLLAEKYFDVRSQACRLKDVYKTACNNFSSAIASEIWRAGDENTPVTLLLARKLRLLADLRSTKFGSEAGEMLREHARYIELMQQRVKGLEAGMAERGGQIASLNQTVAERDGQIASLLSSTSWRVTSLLRFAGRQVRRARHLLRILPGVVQRGGGIKSIMQKAIAVYRREGLPGIRYRLVNRNDYAEWVRRYDTLDDAGRQAILSRIGAMARRPKISVVMPVYEPPLQLLDVAIWSVRKQLYPEWELCIADDASKNEAVRDMLIKHASEEPRIKVVYRKENGHISRASNSALELATGEFVALMDNDDVLPEHALFWVANIINQHPDAALIYSDEDKLSESGKRIDPYFKCDWNPELFLGHNLITHLGVYRSDILKAIGGFRVGFEGAQDYDLAARFVEKIKPEQIVHIPRILYHWRILTGSTAMGIDAKPYALIASEKALNEHLNRRGIKGRVEALPYGHRVYFDLPHGAPLVSIIIPTRNGVELVRKCVTSIFELTTYKNYEILLVDNGSDDPKTLRSFKELERKHSNFRVIRDDRPFNYSALNNLAVKQANGEIITLLNNDIEVISPHWLSDMVSIALQPGVGAVGAKLIYPNDTIQHAGVILGIGGWAGHAHKGFPSSSFGYVARLALMQNFSAVTGACLTVTREKFFEVGGLNEIELAVGCNDVDLCLKLKCAGYRNVWTPYAELYHHESATRGYEDTPEKQIRFRDEVLFMKKRWGDVLVNDPAYNPNLTLDREDFSFSWPPRVSNLNENNTF